MPGEGEKKADGTKDFAVDVPMDDQGFYLRGSAHLGWGMKDRLSRIFNPQDGRTLMLAFDHGYIMGPTSGLERMDLAIPPLIPHIDCLMCTRGGIQTCIPPTVLKPVKTQIGEVGRFAVMVHTENAAFLPKLLSLEHLNPPKSRQGLRSRPHALRRRRDQHSFRSGDR